MSNNISKLPSKNAKGHKDVIEVLEKYLDRAKRGEIEAVAIATVFLDDDRDKACNHEIAVGYDNYGFTLYTSVDILKVSMMEWMRQNQIQED